MYDKATITEFLMHVNQFRCKRYWLQINILCQTSSFFPSTAQPLVMLCQTAIVYLQASGVEIDGDCKLSFVDLKLRHKHRYVVYSVSADFTRIVTKKKASAGEHQRLSLCTCFQLLTGAFLNVLCVDEMSCMAEHWKLSAKNNFYNTPSQNS